MSETGREPPRRRQGIVGRRVPDIDISSEGMLGSMSPFCLGFLLGSLVGWMEESNEKINERRCKDGLKR